MEAGDQGRGQTQVDTEERGVVIILVIEILIYLLLFLCTLIPCNVWI